MIFSIQDKKHPKQIPVVFNNDSKYGYDFIIKEAA